MNTRSTLIASTAAVNLRVGDTLLQEDQEWIVTGIELRPRKRVAVSVKDPANENRTRSFLHRRNHAVAMSHGDRERPSIPWVSIKYGEKEEIGLLVVKTQHPDGTIDRAVFTQRAQAELFYRTLTGESNDGNIPVRAPLETA